MQRAGRVSGEVRRYLYRHGGAGPREAFARALCEGLITMADYAETTGRCHFCRVPGGCRVSAAITANCPNGPLLQEIVQF